MTKPLPKVDTAYTVDPLSDLVSATELRIWRNHQTTKKLLRYLSRYRAQMMESLAEGDSLLPNADASAMKTTEFVAKCQMLKDIATLEAKEMPEFYNLNEPKDEDKK